MQDPSREAHYYCDLLEANKKGHQCPFKHFQDVMSDNFVKSARILRRICTLF
jgi:hypothetical protein